MKNYIILFLVISIYLCFYNGNLSSQPTNLLNKKLQNVIFENQIQLPQKGLPLEMLSNKYTKSKGESFSKYTIGTTEYDFQSNASINRNIYLYDDKTIAAVWNFGTGNFSNGGTGYNYFDGENWGKQPKDRIEQDYASGWGGYAPFYNGEIVISHDRDGNLVMSTREEKGKGEWNVKLIKAPPEINLGWPRFVIVGDTIHILSTSVKGYQGVQTPIIYSRSVDKGETWTHRILPGMDSIAEQIAYFPDTYAWATPQNGKLAFAVGNMWHDVFIMKSNDGGETWTKKVIFEHPKPFFFHRKEKLDTTYVPDGCLDIEFDKNGKLHLVFSVYRILVLYPESFAYYFLPFSSYLAYWNEDFEPYKTLDMKEMYNNNKIIAWLQDLNGDGEIFADFMGPMQVPIYGNGSLVSQPQLIIDENNNMYVTFTHLNENLNTGPPKYQYYRHIWATKSEDGGVNWSRFSELTGGILNEYTECVFPAMSRTSDDYIHVLYQSDDWPGSSAAGHHEQNTASMVYTRVLKSDIGVVSENIKEYNSINNVVIYPNPADDFINIQVLSPFSTKLNIKIRNILGQVVHNQDFSIKAGNNSLTLNTTSLTRDIYLIEFQARNYKTTQKLIIER